MMSSILVDIYIDSIMEYILYPIFPPILSAKLSKLGEVNNYKMKIVSL